MSTPISIAAKYLIAAGVMGDALVTALVEIETALRPGKSANAERQARYRERNKALRNVTSVTETLPSPLSPSFSPTPPITTPITPTIPETIAREPSKSKRGTRLSDDFEPDESCHKLAEKLLLTTAETQNAYDNFMDYWRAVPGAKGLKLDWQMTFKNRLRTVAEWKGKQNGKAKANTIKGGFDVIDAAVAELRQRESGVLDGNSQTDTQDLPRLRQVNA